MSEPKVEFVEPQGFTINFPSIGAPMAVRAEGDEIVILMSLTIRPRDNVVDVNFNVAASGDSTSMPSLNENPASDLSGYWRAPLRG